MYVHELSHAAGETLQILSASRPAQVVARPACVDRRSLKLVEQRPCLFEIGGGEALGEPAVDRGEQVEDSGAATLLHLGPGMANGLANIHNSNKASTAMVNIVDDHAI